MTTVKADAKGRLTGATPTKEYIKTESPEGVVTFTPVEPAAMPDLGPAKEEKSYLYVSSSQGAYNRLLIDFPVKETPDLHPRVRKALEALEVTEVHISGKGYGGLWADVLSKEEGLTVYIHQG